MRITILLVIIVIGLNTKLAFSQKNDTVISQVYHSQAFDRAKNDHRILNQVLQGSTTSLSHFEVYAAVLSPGKPLVSSQINKAQDELIIVKDGQINLKLKGVTTILERGGIALIMPGDEYSVVNNSKQVASFYLLRYKSKQPADVERVQASGGSIVLNWKDVEYNKNEKGARKNFFNQSTSQVAKFEMHSTALNAGLDSHAPHTHKEEEIILILKGNVKMHINGTLHPAAPGDVVFLASGVPHALLNTGTEQAEYFAFQWSN